MTVDGNYFRRLKTVKNVRRMSDDDLLVTFTAEKISSGALTGRLGS